MKKIAIFASGTGSNAAKIVKHLKGHKTIEVVLIVSNKSTAGVLSMASQNGIPTEILNRQEFNNNEGFLEKLSSFEVDFIVLAGFLWLVPGYLVQAYTKRIVNIHPALLPKYGGKGMYGMNVHKAVKSANESESGPTIHFVNEHYDEGDIIFQVKTEILESDTPDDIAAKVLKLEHQYYPIVVEKVITDLPPD